MGNKDSRQTFSHGHMYIEMPQSQYIGGETMQGVIHLSLDHKFPTKVLQLEISGNEKTKWVTKEKHGKSTHIKKHTGKNSIFYTKTILYAFPDGQAPTGQYSFPFLFQLPEWLPSSFVYYGPKKSAINIKYKVVARMEECADTSKTVFKPFECKRRLIVRKPMQQIAMNRQITLAKNIKTMFFVKQGPSKVNVTFEKDAYNPGETAIVLCDIDNTQCEKDLKEVKIKLRRLINCTASDQKRFKDNLIIAKAKYDGVKAGQKAMLKLELNLGSITKESRYLRNHCSKKKKNKTLEPEDIALQELMLPTAMSSLIQCSYFLEVKFEHSGLTFKSAIPKAVTPLLIYPGSISNQFHQIVAPQNWNPHVFQPLQVAQVPLANQSYAIGVPPEAFQQPYFQNQVSSNQYPTQQYPSQYPPSGMMQQHQQMQQQPSLNYGGNYNYQSPNLISPEEYKNRPASTKNNNFQCQNLFAQNPCKKGIEYEPNNKPQQYGQQPIFPDEMGSSFNPQDRHE